jgi:hypothetical protein
VEIENKNEEFLRILENWEFLKNGEKFLKNGEFF